MAQLGDIKITVKNEFIEMQALITEREGMVAANQDRVAQGVGQMSFTAFDFQRLAEKMRALKNDR
jgi:hypothetical protein